MKRLIFILLLLPYLSNAQVKDSLHFNMPIRDSLLVYESVVSMNGKSKDSVYSNAEKWISNKFGKRKLKILDEYKSEREINARFKSKIRKTKRTWSYLVFINNTFDVTIRINKDTCMVRFDNFTPKGRTSPYKFAADSQEFSNLTPKLDKALNASQKLMNYYFTN